MVNVEESEASRIAHNEATAEGIRAYHQARDLALDTLVGKMMGMTRRQQSVVLAVQLSSEEDKSKWPMAIELYFEARSIISDTKHPTKLMQLQVRLTKSLRDPNLTRDGRLLQVKTALEASLSSSAAVVERQISRTVASPLKGS